MTLRQHLVTVLIALFCGIGWGSVFWLAKGQELGLWAGVIAFALSWGVLILARGSK